MPGGAGDPLGTIDELKAGRAETARRVHRTEGEVLSPEGWQYQDEKSFGGGFVFGGGGGGRRRVYVPNGASPGRKE